MDSTPSYERAGRMLISVWAGAALILVIVTFLHFRGDTSPGGPAPFPPATIGAAPKEPALLRAMTTTRLGDRAVAVTGGTDGTVRVWDLTTGTQLGAQIGRPLTGHTGRVTAVTATRLHGRPVAVTGSADGTVRIWDLAAHKQLGQALTGHTAGVTAVLTTTLEGRMVAVSAGRDSTVRVWDLAGHRRLGRPFTDPSRSVVAAGTITERDGRPVVVFSGSDGAVWLWDPATRARLDQPLGEAGAYALTAGELDGRPIVVSVGLDATAQVWDPTGRERLGRPVGHAGPVVAAAVTDLAGRPVLVTGGVDSVHVLDLRRLTSEQAPGERAEPVPSQVRDMTVRLTEAAETGQAGAGTVAELESRAPDPDFATALMNALGPMRFRDLLAEAVDHQADGNAHRLEIALGRALGTASPRLSRAWRDRLAGGLDREGGGSAAYALTRALGQVRPASTARILAGYLGDLGYIALDGCDGLDPYVHSPARRRRAGARGLGDQRLRGAAAPVDAGVVHRPGRTGRLPRRPDRVRRASPGPQRREGGRGPGRRRRRHRRENGGRRLRHAHRRGPAAQDSHGQVGGLRARTTGSRGRGERVRGPHEESGSLAHRAGDAQARPVRARRSTRPHPSLGLAARPEEG
ncbi:hypothetical protein OG320_30800 [Microbispora sp. NBC_01189]|uniref:hypothetical protein n=1 Tax=Microbispora sp. NBC_01189 TaxID=2903583 RepID=UPI002E1445EE|nr:hypothetical protein OG320_30800 [Microbispora sp. NBC_01189]